MKKINLKQHHLTAICLIFVTGITVFGQSRSPQKPISSVEVLPWIERYRPPRYPKTLYLDRETYDYRIQNKSPVPATLTDVFICDIWQRVTMDLKLTLNPQDVSESVIKQAMGVYLERGHDDIAGYRPWTHWHFIRKLTAAQRESLAREIVAYIKKNGIRDVEN